MKKMVGLILTAIAVLSGCAQATGVVQDDGMIASENNRAVSVSEGELPTLCLIGDSRVASMPDDLFSGEYQAYNYGVGGASSYHSALVLQYLFSHGRRFDYVVISVGINDLIGGLSYNQSKSDILAILGYAVQISDNVYITTVPGCRASSAMSQQTASAVSINCFSLSAYINSVAGIYGVTVIPLASMFNESSGFYLSTAYDIGDGTHYNAFAYSTIHDTYAGYLQ